MVRSERRVRGPGIPISYKRGPAPSPYSFGKGNEADPEQPAGSDESQDIGAVQRLYTRLAQIIREEHRFTAALPDCV